MFNAFALILGLLLCFDFFKSVVSDFGYLPLKAHIGWPQVDQEMF